MTTLRIALFATLCGSLLSLPALAQDGNDGFGRPGGYLAVGVGGAAQTFAGIGQTLANTTDLGTPLLIQGRLGNRVNKYVALEATVDYSLTGFEASQPGTGTLTAKNLVSTANLKLYPGDWRIQPFIMGGAGVVWGTLDCKTPAGVSLSCSAATGGFLSDSEVVFGGRVGGGLDFYLTKHIALTGELAYVIPTGALADLSYLTFGGQLMFRF